MADRSTKPPTSLRIGHLRYSVMRDDAALAHESVRRHGELSGWSSSVEQRIVLATRGIRDGASMGTDYMAETLLHEVLHCCLRVASCDPDADAAAKVEDVEERAVSAIAGPGPCWAACETTRSWSTI